MNQMLFALALVLAQVVSAGELDQEQILMSQAAQRLPGTVVLRTNLKDPSKVEVLHVSEKLPGNKKEALKIASKLRSAPFVAMNIDSQLTGRAASEKDAVASTSSWFFGFHRRSHNQHGYNNHQTRPNYSYYTRPYYGSHYPTYSYSGYNYAYQPYYNYNYGSYAYSYCQNPVPTYSQHCQPSYQNCNNYSSQSYGYNPYWSAY